MTYALAWLATIVVFLGLDAIWLKRVMVPLFERHVGEMMLEQPKMGVAAAFYALYCAGVVWFASVPGAEVGSWLTALAHGAAFGLVAYGTYEATNYATLKRWHSHMVAIDLAGGTVLTALAAVAGYFVIIGA